MKTACLIFGLMAGHLTAAPLAVKLWPQLTDGTTNHAGTLAMRCEVAKDGLTVTDTAWGMFIPGSNTRVLTITG